MKNKSVRIAAFFMMFALLISAVLVPVSADEAQATGSVGNGSTLSSFSGDFSNDYKHYRDASTGFAPAKNDLSLRGSAYAAESGSESRSEASFDGEEEVLVWESEKGRVDYLFDVPENGLYNITFRYKMLGNSERDLDIGLLIDGKAPFDGTDELELPRYWVDATEPRTDDIGNQFAPEQASYDGFVTKSLYDNSGATVFPYEFALTAGSHTITVQALEGQFALAEISLTVPDSVVPSYEEVSAEYAKKGYQSANADVQIIEGESADLKSTRSLVPYAENSSPSVTPSSSSLSIINYIGGTNWKMPNEELTWNIDVPADGLYQLGTRFKQDAVIDGISYRMLRIDGKVPFSECTSLAFSYDTKWQDKIFSDENGNPYEFYLTAGLHTLTLAGTMGDFSDSYYDLKVLSSEIGSFYLEIVMITGESPDSNRSYELFKTIPDFQERLEDYQNRLNALAADLKALSNGKGTSLIAAINNMSRVMKSMYDNKYSSQNYVSDYYNQYVTLSSWLYEMQSMGLSIDQIQLVPAEKDFAFKKVNFFQKFGFSVKRFCISFSKSYSRISVAKEGSVSLKIWVNWGRDQAQVLNNLINESFTAYAEQELGYPVSVNLELVNADIIKGMLSNNAPDLSLQLPRSTPVNLAMRGALVDLSQFDDYEEVMKQFGKSAGVPYQYSGGSYALPDTQSFYIMFYRTDIFKSLGLSVPNTWDEFLATTAVLQRNNMNSYLPYTKIAAADTVNTGVGGLNMFCSILMQNDGSVYNEALDECLLDTPTSLKAFTYWTDMYTKYKIPTEASFYNRFRVGTMPLGIMPYTQYTTFMEAAPEITDRWGIAMIPGIQKEDGTIDHTISGSGTGCSVLAASEHQKEAWTFLKWWVSDTVQTRYNTNVESILGTISRVTTANLKSFENMSWDRKDLSILLEQRSWIEEVPEVPGSYYVSRSVDQAFWNIVNGDSMPKDALTQWGIEANNEIKRKMAEYAN